MLKKSLKELVELVKNSLDIIISIKLNQEIDKFNENNTELSLAQEYEKLLQKEENNSREHISIEHRLRIQCEKYAQELDILEQEKIFLLLQLVSKIKLLNNINNRIF